MVTQIGSAPGDNPLARTMMQLSLNTNLDIHFARRSQYCGRCAPSMRPRMCLVLPHSCSPDTKQHDNMK